MLDNFYFLKVVNDQEIETTAELCTETAFSVYLKHVRIEKSFWIYFLEYNFQDEALLVKDIFHVMLVQRNIWYNV